MAARCRALSAATHAHQNQKAITLAACSEPRGVADHIRPLSGGRGAAREARLAAAPPAHCYRLLPLALPPCTATRVAVATPLPLLLLPLRSSPSRSGGLEAGPGGAPPGPPPPPAWPLLPLPLPLPLWCPRPWGACLDLMNGSRLPAIRPTAMLAMLRGSRLSLYMMMPAAATSTCDQQAGWVS